MRERQMRKERETDKQQEDILPEGGGEKERRHGLF